MAVLAFTAVLVFIGCLFGIGGPYKEVETNQTKSNSSMTNKDYQYCKGFHCPNRGQCKRYVDGLEAAKENEAHSWIQSCRHATLFIHKDGSEEVNI